MNRLHYNTILGANEAIEGHDSVAVAMELSFKVNNAVKYIINHKHILFNSNGCVEE